MVSVRLVALLVVAFVSCEANEKACAAGASCPIEMDPEVGANLNLLQTSIHMHSVVDAENIHAEWAKGQCETYKTTDKFCADGSTCCDGYGCGGSGEGDAWKSTMQCVPCGWAAYNKKFTSDSCPKPPLATIPVVWQVIKTTTGEGDMSVEEINKMMDDVNKRFAGVDVSSWTPPKPENIPAGPDVAGILAGGCSTDKCNVGLCYKKGAETDAATKEQIKAECMCGDQFCQWAPKYADEKAMEKPSFWKVNKLHGNRLDTGIRFKVDSINYVTNDDWYHHCCCAHASKTYKPAQTEIFDQLIDKTTVRSKATVITCEMKPKGGGGTAGQSSIAGASSCAGGPGIMVDRDSMKPYTHAWAEFSNGAQANTVVHEFGHFLGLSHTFAETCSSGSWGTCKPEEICNPRVNEGDHVDDTPVHIKQGKCKMDASGDTTANSCPNSPGKDPLDSFMSYSDCPAQRFTQGQVARMHSTIEKYFPAFLTKSDGRVAKDFTCDPEFPSGVIPAGYKRKSSTQTPAPSPNGGGGGIQTCSSLEADQCATDTTGCVCAAATNCCKDFGCAKWKVQESGLGKCLPCSWADGGASLTFTTDSCKTI